jgi:hypothetical protein
MMPNELPRNLEAERIYAAAWASWLLETDRTAKRALECTMDEQQGKIATNPDDPRWQRFADSLPGFRRFWARTGSNVRKKVKA